MDDRSWTTDETLWLADWRRRLAELYTHVRSVATTAGPESAWRAWRMEREELFRTHPSSPVPAAEREAVHARHWPYEPALRFEAVVVEDAEPEATGAATLRLPTSGATIPPMRRLGRATIPFPDRERTLSLFWLEEYAGGIFLPFRDATNGTATYGAGRYLLDTAKSADLGGDAVHRTLALDFNFAYHPSCAFDPRWACPLAPPENRLDRPIEAGERLD